MCGISVVIDRAGSEDLPAQLRQLHDAIRHRGPDGESTLLFDRDCQQVAPESGRAAIGLAFRWLVIQDHSREAIQPFVSHDERQILLFNGEIYNFRELRRELETEGFRFRTRSDTEVVSSAYRRWGTDCFRRFAGMWAIVVLDRDEKTLTLSRDRFGIKPLFYRADGYRLAISSEVKQLLALGQKRRIHSPALLHFLIGSRLPGREHTFFEGLHAVPPGTHGTVALAGSEWPIRFRPYWTLDPPGALVSDEEAVNLVRERIHLVVGEHMTAEVPVATFLSGGVDSSLLTGTIHASGVRIPTFSMRLRAEADRLDESRFIDATLRQLGVPNASVDLTGGMVRDNFDRVASSHEEPLSGMAVIAQFLTFELAATGGVKVILDGQGSDEIFAGYGHQTNEFLIDLLLHFRWLTAGREIRQFAMHEPAFTRRLARAIGARIIGRPLRMMHRMRPAPLLRIERPALERLRNHDRPSSAYVGSRLSQTLYSDVMSLNLYDVLGIGDRNSMAHSIESRVPFVDHRLVELAFALPDSTRIRGGWRKRIVRDLAAEVVPEEVAYRRDKMGFAIPQARWMREHFRGDLAGLANHDVLTGSGLFDRRALETRSRQFLEGDDRFASDLWRVLATVAWAEHHDVVLE